MRPRLFDFELAWADAAFDAFFPDGSALVHGIKQLKPGAFLDDMLADRELWLETSLGLRVTLWMIALAPLFVLRRFATIASLDAEERETLLDRLLTSRIYAVRQLVAGFKAMGSLCYSQSTAIRKQMTTPASSPALPASSLLRAKTKPIEEHEHAAE